MRVFGGIMGFIVGGIIGVPVSFPFQSAWVQRAGFGTYVSDHFDVMIEVLKHLDRLPTAVRAMSSASSNPLFGAVTSFTGNPVKVSLVTMLSTACIGTLIGILLAGLASASPTQKEGSDRVLISSGTETSESIILCKSCSSVFSADNKGKRCDHCGAILR